MRVVAVARASRVPSDVVESESRVICGATVQGQMGFGRIAAADEAGPNQTDATIGRSYVLSKESSQAGLDVCMYGDVCG
jgi:hypothetical protein